MEEKKQVHGVIYIKRIHQPGNKKLLWFLIPFNFEQKHQQRKMLKN